MKSLLIVATLAVSFTAAVQAAPLDVSEPKAYRDAHRVLAERWRSELDLRRAEQSLQDLALHQRERPLRELCRVCESTAKRLGADDSYEPGVWLYQPSGKYASRDAHDALIAFPPAGDERSWSAIEALTLDGHWVTLSVEQAPSVPVFVLRINGALSFERQIELANAQLRAAGLQRPAPRSKGSGRWTTRLESIHLADDEEPWISGAAEVYAITSGVLPGNQPQVQIVDLPYLDHDGRTYYPRQVVLDWANYSYGVANIQLYEHDDNTNYQQLVTLLIQAIGQGGTLFGQPEVAAIAEIAARIVAAMPAGWFSNDDDYVDSLYSVEKYEAESNRYGARANARVSYIPYELPSL